MNQPLIDIIDECIDRIAAGENIDQCISDYPEYADDIRDMLSIGALIGQLAPSPTDADMAHQRTRQQLTSRIEQEENRPMLGRMKQKRKRRTVGVYTMGTAAILALIAGIGIGIVGMNLASTSGGKQADITSDVGLATPVPIVPMVETVEVEVIRPVYRYAEEWAAFANNRPGWFLILNENTPIGVFKVEVVNPSVPRWEHVRITMPPEAMTPMMPPQAMDGWTLSDDDGNLYIFGDTNLTDRGMRVYTRDGYDGEFTVYMNEEHVIWDTDDTLTLRDADGNVIVEASVSDIVLKADDQVDLENENINQPANGLILPEYLLEIGVVYPDQEGERVRFTSPFGTVPNLANWIISDDDGNQFIIPPIPGESTSWVEIYTGDGDDELGRYYWNQPEPVWQLDDVLTLYRPNGEAMYRIVVEDSIQMAYHLGEPSVPEFALDSIQMTATQLIKEATIAANPEGIGTPVPMNPFAITATALISEITATAEADLTAIATEGGFVGPEDGFILTATQIINEITATARANTSD